DGAAGRDGGAAPDGLSAELSHARHRIRLSRRDRFSDGSDAEGAAELLGAPRAGDGAEDEVSGAHHQPDAGGGGMSDLATPLATASAAEPPPVLRGGADDERLTNQLLAPVFQRDRVWWGLLALSAAGI